ncbi:MAG: hypothetical protein HN726_00215 [Candidatus Magasanikbacteria bacterium]|jgi:hypothetical protein|nr:hypothetical protein [Candidatus Magasanikbacteria bacterium]MBT4221073.1 hypothetical protein [Candidatus Magasanikbacteria bacterium]MBT4350583.1 hypothetical protein [Candidatus Magasanikbacteria bacterium]MBT4542118.1 hypothetical protein [Candidatus Magasanikbacteria bacterium]MBT6253240.1 hypothetical protein [Candidatus Magasanikbacteria bacterium]
MRQFRRKKQTMRQRKQAVTRIFLSNTSRFALIAIVATFGFLNVTQITGSLSTGGYDMGDLRRDISGLDREIQKIEVEIAEEGSIIRIQERLKSENIEMVPVGSDLAYINLPGTTVAVR